jgi:hypothetical protein
MNKVKITDVISVEISESGYEVNIGFRGDCSDKYHSMHDLYKHRMALNIALFHAWYNTSDYHEINVFKSKKHSDGTMFDGYFIVMAINNINKEQISYHYKLKHWDKFNIPEIDICPFYDNHNSENTIERLISWG